MYWVYQAIGLAEVLLGSDAESAAPPLPRGISTPTKGELAVCFAECVLRTPRLGRDLGTESRSNPPSTTPGCVFAHQPVSMGVPVEARAGARPARRSDGSAHIPVS